MPYYAPPIIFHQGSIPPARPAKATHNLVGLTVRSADRQAPIFRSAPQSTGWMGFESYLIEFLIERSMNLVKQNPSGSRVAMLRVTSPIRQPATCFPAGMADWLRPRYL